MTRCATPVLRQIDPVWSQVWLGNGTFYSGHVSWNPDTGMYQGFAFNSAGGVSTYMHHETLESVLDSVVEEMQRQWEWDMGLKTND